MLLVTQDRLLTSEEFRKMVAKGLCQAYYDQPAKHRPKGLVTKSLRNYLPDTITQLDLLNAVRFLRAHDFIERVSGYRWRLKIDYADIENICFQHGEFKPCLKCKRKGVEE